MKYNYNCLSILTLLLIFFNTLHAQFERRLPGVYNQAIYRKTEGKIYAVGFDANIDPTKQFLVRIDPRATTVERLIELPNTPVALALAHDEAYLYIRLGVS